MKRFLIPAGSDITLDFNGFLPDPEDTYGKYYNETIISFEKVENEKCLIILGEPGSGKSTIFREESKKLKNKDINVLFVELKNIDDNESLKEEIFDTEIMKSKKTLYLFLDGLDESIISYDKVANNLIKQLKKLSLDNIYLRISGRTLNFPKFLIDELQKLWNVENKCFELCPLRYKDVESHAKDREINNTNDFFKTIEKHKISSFVNKPITLDPVIELYKSNNLSESQFNIYLSLCKRLLNENNKYRTNLATSGHPKYEGKLSIEERLFIAGRIATCLIFSNKTSVIDSNNINNYTKFISIDELINGYENVNDKKLDITKENIREVLGTSMFSLSKEYSFGFSHKSYTEFLAAWYINQKNIDIDSLMSLITFPESNGEIVPQLYEVASWLAVLNDEVFEKLSESDPEVLISSSVNDFKDKEKLVKKLFGLTENSKISLNYTNRLNCLSKLYYEGVEDYIKTKFNNDFDQIKDLAIDFVDRCNLKTLEDEIYTLAKNSDENHRIRANAFLTLSTIASPELRKKMALDYDELIKDFEKNDEDDSLKGYYLQTIWSDYITANKVFDIIKKPKVPNRMGGYENFLYSHLAKGLKGKPENEIIVALNWIKILPAELPESSYKVKRLVLEIYSIVWDYIDNEDICKFFAETLINRLKKDYTILRNESDSDFYKKFNKDSEKRQKIIKTIIYELDIDEDTFNSSYYHIYIFKSEDVLYLMELYKEEQKKDIKNILLTLIEKMLPSAIWNNESTYVDIEKLYKLINKSEIIKDKFEYLINPAELDDNLEPINDKWKQAKEYHYKYEHKKPKKEKKCPFVITERIEELTDNILNYNDINFWINLVQTLTLTEESTHYASPSLIIENNPAWNECNDELKQKIVSASLKFLEEYNPSNYMELRKQSKTSYAWDAIAFIPYIKDEERLISILKNWIGPILVRPDFNDEGAELLKQELTALCYKKIPEETISTLLEIINTDNSIEYSRLLDNFDKCWDDKLSETVFKFLEENSNLNHKSIAYILENLLEHNYNKAVEYAKDKINNELTQENLNNEELINELIQTLASYSKNASWDFIWNIIIKHEELGFNILKNISYNRSFSSEPLLNKLNETQLAELYIYLHEKLPPEEVRYGAYTVTPETTIYDFKSRVLNFIINNGLIESFVVIREANPKLIANEEWFVHCSMETKRNYYLKEWAKNANLEIINKLVNNFACNNCFQKFIKHYNSKDIDNETKKISQVQNKILNTNENLKKLENFPSSNIKKVENKYPYEKEKKINVYVEDKIDVEFYEAVYNILIKKALIDDSIHIEFIDIPIREKDYSGGCEEVKKFIRQIVKSGDKTKIGLIDKDDNKDVDEDIPGVFLLKRYSIENYLIDPILIYPLLADKNKNNTNNLPTNLNFKAGEDSKIKTFESKELQEVIDFYFEKLYCFWKDEQKNDTIEEVLSIDKEYSSIIYLNDITVKYPNILMTTKGKKLISDFQKCLSAFGAIMNTNLIARLRSTEMIPLEFVDLFKKIIEYSEVNK